MMKAIDDQALCDAVQEMSQGLIDAQLADHIVKKRVALNGKGKRGGARTIVATRKEDHWFFVHGFAKNEKADISTRELAALRVLGSDLLGCTDTELNEAITAKELMEICHGQH